MSLAKWNYYFSGILYGEFVAEGEKINYRWINMETSKLGDFTPLTQEANDDLRKPSTVYVHWANLDVNFELTHLHEYEKAFAGWPDEARTDSGRSYIRRDDGVYAHRYATWPTDVLMGEDGTVAAFLCAQRESIVVFAREGCEDLTVLRQWREAYPGETIYPVRFLGTQRVATRDGVGLATDVFLPVGAGDRLPALLVRTQYNKTSEWRMHYAYAQRGYAVVLHDIRGRDASEGVYAHKGNDIEDGEDTLNWIASQHWSNGRVGTGGASYLGYTQWAMACTGSPHITSLLSMNSGGVAFSKRDGGCLNSSSMPLIIGMSGREVDWGLGKRDDWDEILDIRPLEEIPRKVIGRDIPLFTSWLEHRTYDEYNKKKSIWEQWRGGHVPAFILSGWYDSCIAAAAELLEHTGYYPAKARKIMLGAWEHVGNCCYDYNGIFLGRNAVRYDLDLLYFLWTDYHTRGIENGIDKTPAVEYYTMNEDKWKTAESWPPPCCAAFPLYLGGGGTLEFEQSRNGRVEYEYDPKDRAGRNEGKIFTSLPLDEDLTITGEITAELFISSSAEDTDFFLTLLEISGDGRQTVLSVGRLNTKYREGAEVLKLMEAGCIYSLTIPMTMTSNLFRKGARIALKISSGHKDYFANDFPARNLVHHGGDYPSRIILPVERRV